MLKDRHNSSQKESISKALTILANKMFKTVKNYEDNNAQGPYEISNIGKTELEVFSKSLYFLRGISMIT